MEYKRHKLGHALVLVELLILYRVLKIVIAEDDQGVCVWPGG